MGDLESEATSKLAGYRKGTRDLLLAELPGGGAFMWRVLRGDEKQACLSDAVLRFKALGLREELRSYTDLEDEMVWQILFRAMRDPEDPNKTLAIDVDEVRQLLDPDMRDFLAGQYFDFESDVAPDRGEIPIEIWQAISQAVKKKDATLLSNFEPYMLRTYLLTMDRQQQNSLGSSSGSSESY